LEADPKDRGAPLKRAMDWDREKRLQSPALRDLDKREIDLITKNIYWNNIPKKKNPSKHLLLGLFN
jgi:hypothetical protein